MFFGDYLHINLKRDLSFPKIPLEVFRYQRLRFVDALLETDKLSDAKRQLATPLTGAESIDDFGR